MKAPLECFQESKTALASIIGNEGVLQGSAKDPGDTTPVVGVLSAEPDGQVPPFTLRGMTAHELNPSH